MRISIKCVVLSLVMVTGWSFGQQSAEKPATDKAASNPKPLEDLIAAALRHSPDLQVADAKVREAQAELRRTRLATLQKVIDANAAVEAARAALVPAEASFKSYSRMLQAKAASEEDVRSAEAKFIAAKTQLAQAEASLNTLTGTMPAGVGNVGAVDGSVNGPAIQRDLGGNTPMGIAGGAGIGSGIGGFAGINGLGGGFQGIGGFQGAFGGGVQGTFFGNGFQGAIGGFGGGMPPPRLPRTPMADKVRSALNVTVKVKPLTAVPLADVIKNYRASAEGVPFLLHLGDKGAEPITLSLEGEVQLGGFLQALEDVVPGLKCYIREYGILITLDETQPEGAMPLIEFWHQKSAQEKPK
jgi:hypothetical protein